MKKNASSYIQPNYIYLFLFFVFNFYGYKTTPSPNIIVYCRFKIEELRKEEVKNKLKTELVNTKKLYDEEARKEKERLALSYQWEVERRLREAQVLRELEESRRQAKIEEMNRFRKQLDLQRVSSTTKINELILRHFIIYPSKYIDNNLYLIIVIHSRAMYIGKNVICIVIKN